MRQIVLVLAAGGFIGMSLAFTAPALPAVGRKVARGTCVSANAADSANAAASRRSFLRLAGIPAKLYLGLDHIETYYLVKEIPPVYEIPLIQSNTITCRCRCRQSSPG